MFYCTCEIVPEGRRSNKVIPRAREQVYRTTIAGPVSVEITGSELRFCPHRGSELNGPAGLRIVRLEQSARDVKLVVFIYLNGTSEPGRRISDKQHLSIKRIPGANVKG